jgi:hypothetical protein
MYSKLIQSKIETWLRLRDAGQHFNARLAKNHTFRNPLIMEKMIDFMELDPDGSKLKKSLFDPAGIKLLPDEKELCKFYLTICGKEIWNISKKRETKIGKFGRRDCRSKVQSLHEFQKSWK